MAPDPTPADHDEKSWTWVLERPCPECGADVTSLGAHDIATALRRDAGEWRRLLGRLQLAVRRPAPGVWSAVEYGCHVRDVLAVFAERLGRMLSEDDPLFVSWDHEAAAVEGHYADAEPSSVAYALAANAGKVADLFDRVTPRTADRPGRRSDGATFTVITLGRYGLHDCTHHLADVARGYEILTGGDA